MFALMMSAMTLMSCGEGDHRVPTINEVTGDKDKDNSGSDNKEDDNNGTNDENTDEDGMYSWEKDRTEIPDYTDMVLLYGGNHARTTFNWASTRLQSYVSYADTNNAEHWLFDAFLFLEIYDAGSGGANVTFATGYKDSSTGLPYNSATKDDWQALINYLFSTTYNLSALDKEVATVAGRIGTPPTKRKVIISIPEPIKYYNTSNTSSSTQYWGKVDNKTLDFSKNEDRVTACKWFVDQVRAAFDKMNYQNIELAGFYWLAEKSTDTEAIMTSVADYLHQYKYSFNWIPYFNATGYSNWKLYGFDYAFLQPNYFFNTSTPISRLKEAASQAQKAGMAMEMEFDENVLAYYNSPKATRLSDYMQAFRTYNVWDTQRIAYYQGNSAVHYLRLSTNATDQELYHEFCNFVITRPIRP